MITIVLLKIIQQKVPTKYTYTSCQIYELKVEPTANRPFRIPSQRAYKKRLKKRTKPEPKNVHVASRTNLYYLNETKSMNAQVKFPFRFRLTPFPFAFKNVRVAFLLFRHVAVSLRLHSVSLRLRSIVKLSVAFAFNCTSIRLIARLLLSLKAGRKCTVCIQ